MGTHRRLVASMVAGVVLVAGVGACTSPRGPVDVNDPSPTTTPSATPAEDAPASDEHRDATLLDALDHVPASASTMVFTDYVALRERLGFGDLTSESTRAERAEFWERATDDAVLLTDGRLREDNSVLELDYGFTQEDVDWELAFTGPDGLAGWALGFRPGVDLDRVAAAVDALVGPFDQDTVRSGSTVLGGDAIDHGGARSMAALTDVAATLGEPAETTYLHRGPPGCLPLTTVLGPDGDVEDQQRVLAAHDISRLGDFDGFSFGFTGDEAVATLSYADASGVADIERRARLTEGWPAADGIAFGDSFGAAVPDTAASDGRGLGLLTLPVRDHRAAARITLTEQLPFAVCSDVDLLPEPTGL